MKNFSIRNAITKGTLVKITVSLLFLIFVARATELALTINGGIPPDEHWHMTVINLFKTQGFHISNSPDLYYLGDVTTIPYLYHFILGTFSRLLPEGNIQLYALRMISVGFSTLTIYITYKIAQELTKNKLVWILTVVFMTTVPMYTFLSSAVNYDTLTNLFATLTIYLLILFFHKPTINIAFSFFLAIGLGSLTKISFLPLVVITLIIFSIIVLFELKKDKEYIRKIITTFNKTSLLLISFLILVFIGGLDLYVRNIDSYGTIYPSCDKVLSYEACLNNGAFERNQILSKQESLPEAIDRFNYFNFWYDKVIQRSTGILAHQSMIKPVGYIIPYKVILFISIIGLIRSINRKRPVLIILTSITITYILFLAYFQNYESYLKTGSISNAVQGRYIFPVLSPLTVIMAYSLLNIIKNKTINILIVITCFTIFFLGDYVYFKRNVPDDWYNGSKASYYVIKSNRLFSKNYKLF